MRTAIDFFFHVQGRDFLDLCQLCIFCAPKFFASLSLITSSLLNSLRRCRSLLLHFDCCWLVCWIRLAPVIEKFFAPLNSLRRCRSLLLHFHCCWLVWIRLAPVIEKFFAPLNSLRRCRSLLLHFHCCWLVWIRLRRCRLV